MGSEMCIRDRLTAVIELVQSHDGYQALLHGSGAELRDRLGPVLTAIDQ